MTDTNARQQEQRLVLRVLNHWRELAGERPMPTVEDVANLASGDIRDDCFVVDLAHPGELVFRAVGARQREILGSDPTGLKLSAIGENTLLGRAVSYHAQVLDRGAPVSVGGQFVNERGQAMLYRSILLPLGASEISALLGCVNSRVVVTD